MTSATSASSCPASPFPRRSRSASSPATSRRWSGATASDGCACRRAPGCRSGRRRRSCCARRAAIRRHPADDYLELVAARAALRDDPTTAMHDLNRALRLHPTNWQAHRLAARLLLASGHPAQAALEYRLALASGMVLDLNELTRLLAGHVVEAVP